MRKLSGREKGLLGLLAVVAVALSAWALAHSDAPAALGKQRAERPLLPVPLIDLARIDGARAESEAGRRDLFTFGTTAPSEDVDVTPPPVAAATTSPGGTAGAPEGMPGALASGPVTPSLPPLSLKYIGSVENKSGVKVAVLVTDKREVLTGQAGQVVANRYRIARIGLESVDLEDVNSGQSRRIALKGN